MAARSLRLLKTDGPPPRDLARSLVRRCAFPVPDPDLPPSRLACAVSGGPDSLALLVLAVEAGLHPVAYQVDHGLRPGSSDEVEVVRRAASVLAGRLREPSGGIEVVALRVEVPPGPNLEARARSARFGVLPPDVATGHTADDQAETILINLLRGAGTAGLAGMRPGPRHPLLALRRAETRAVCREAGLEWVEDPSNRELGPLRNRVRHQLLPSLAELSGRDPVPILCRQAELLGDDDTLLESLAATLDPTSARELAAAAAPLARRAVRAWLKQVAGSSHPPSAAVVERVLEVARGGPLACEVGGGIAVRRRRGRLVVEHDGSPPVR
ncbi:MAG TPA: tRNA lysidine(34) synthetase TilS [Acidimicrobiales bacterium]|nr:tRNA lysidine(34) synthetase TilS [Acidimicrobiales bacterium]